MAPKSSTTACEDCFDNNTAAYCSCSSISIELNCFCLCAWCICQRLSKYIKSKLYYNIIYIIIYIILYYYMYIIYLVSASLKCCSKSSGNSHKAFKMMWSVVNQEFSGAMFGGASSIAVWISGLWRCVAVLKGRVTRPASSRGIWWCSRWLWTSRGQCQEGREVPQHWSTWSSSG